MALSFDSVLILSSNPAQMMQFISFILDIGPIDSNEESISFQFEDTLFKIQKYTGRAKIHHRGFSLNVDSSQELVEIKQMVEFYYYREGNQGQAHTSLNHNRLEFVDPDKSKWSVNVMDNSCLYNSKNNKNHLTKSNVRIF